MFQLDLHWTFSGLFKYRELGTSLRESKLIPSHWYRDKLLFEQYSAYSTSKNGHSVHSVTLRDRRKSRESPIFAQSEKVEYLQKSLTSPISAWTIHRPTFQLYYVKSWCNSIQQEPRYLSFCS